MFFRNVGVKVDSVLLVTIALGDFQNATGADKFFDGVAQGATVGVDGLQHHWRVADGYKLRTLEHVHQGQGAVLLAGRNGRAGQDGAVDRRDECHLIPDLEYLIDIQCRKADVAFGPELVGIEAAFEIAENGFDVSRL